MREPFSLTGPLHKKVLLHHFSSLLLQKAAGKVFLGGLEKVGLGQKGGGRATKQYLLTGVDRFGRSGLLLGEVRWGFHTWGQASKQVAMD